MRPSFGGLYMGKNRLKGKSHLFGKLMVGS